MNAPKAKICVVDDDRSVRLSLGALLKAHGNDIATYDSAEAFLDGYDESAVDCLIVDVRMPGMSGLDLQKQLTQKSTRIPVIVVTGHGDIPMAVEAMKFGAIDFIEKPCTEPALLTAVERALNSKSPANNAKPPAAVIEERLARLTERERQVLDHLVLGEINKVIAHTLNISQRTVEIHRARIKEKMEAQSLSDLIRMML